MTLEDLKIQMTRAQHQADLVAQAHRKTQTWVNQDQPRCAWNPIPGKGEESPIELFRRTIPEKYSWETIPEKQFLGKYSWGTIPGESTLSNYLCVKSNRPS
jgi:hypothetical protein